MTALVPTDTFSIILKEITVGELWIWYDVWGGNSRIVARNVKAEILKVPSASLVFHGRPFAAGLDHR